MSTLSRPHDPDTEHGARRLDALIVFPPLWTSLVAPYPSLAVLGGAVVEAGLTSRVLDLNAALLERLVVEPHHLELERWGFRDELALIEEDAHVDEEIGSILREVIVTALRLDHLAEEGPRLLARAREGIRALEGEGRVVHRMPDGADAGHLPSAVLDGLVALDRHVQGLAELFEESGEPWPLGAVDALVDELLTPVLLDARPRVVGMSLVTPLQLPVAVGVAAKVKALVPDATVVLGGNLVTHAGPDLLDDLSSAALVVDAVTRYEGEVALVELCRRHRTGADIRDVPNTALVVEGEPLAFPPRALRVTGALSLPLVPGGDGRYLSTTIPLRSGEGCYWGRCAFCSHHVVFGPGFKGRGPEALEVLLRRALASSPEGGRVFFTDDALPPRVLAELARLVPTLPGSLRWGAYVRLEPRLADPSFATRLAEAGCDTLVLGFESASQRVLDAMDKGIRADHIEPVLTTLLEAGIRVEAYYMLGFPGETDDDRAATHALVERWAGTEGLGLMGHLFVPRPLTPVTEAPDRFGLVEDEDGDLTVEDMDIPAIYGELQELRSLVARASMQAAMARGGGPPPSDRRRLVVRRHLVQVGDDDIPAALCDVVLGQADPEVAPVLQLASGRLVGIAPRTLVTNLEEGMTAEELVASTGEAGAVELVRGLVRLGIATWVQGD